MTLTPLDILEQRIVTKGGHQITQFLVKWQALPPFFFFETGNVKALPPTEATREDLPALTHRFPDLNLEDKIRLHGCGNVTNLQDHSGTLRHNKKDKQSPKYLDEYVVPKAKKGPLPQPTTVAHIAPAAKKYLDQDPPI